MVGNPGVEPGSSWSQARRVTVSLAPGGEGRNRTGSATLAGRARYLTCHPHALRGPLRSRTGNLLLARESLCQLELAAQGRRALNRWVSQRRARRHRGRPMLACRIGAHAMEFSPVFRLTSLSKRLARTAGIEPAHAALETAVLPLNYVPKGRRERKTARQVSLRAVPVNRLCRRHTGTRLGMEPRKA
jgi:hypothetical protein